MRYHVIHCQDHNVTTLTPSEVLNMEEDAEGRIIVYGTDKKSYFLLAAMDYMKE